MARPAVSVILPVHGDEPYLDEALDSLRNQHFQDFEIIIVAETPSESTRAFLSNRRDRDSFKIERVPAGTGLSESLNRGIELARGEFVARQDADDWSHPDRFSSQVEYLCAHPDIGLLGTAGTIEKPDGSSNTYTPPETNAELRWESLWTNPFFHTSAMFRRDLLEEYDLSYRADDPFTFAEDYDLWMQIMRHAKVANLPVPLITYREHEGSLSQQHAERQTRNFTTLALRTITARTTTELSVEQFELIHTTLYQGSGFGAESHRDGCEAAQIYLDVLSDYDRPTSAVRELAAKRALGVMIPPQSITRISDYLRPFRVYPWLPVTVVEHVFGRSRELVASHRISNN